MLIVLSSADGEAAEEISEKTGIRKEVVYHILELLSFVGLVKRCGSKYYADEIYREMARLIIRLPEPDSIIN
ncbi:hypothetical protein AAGT10_00620 [Sulfolobus tengchongensis]|jgi:DNA-binding IclR family transcriptional regulator